MKKIWKNTLLAAAMFLMALFTCIPLLSVVRAEDSTSGFADEYSRLIDMGEIVDESDEEELLAALDELSERQKLEVAIATVESLEGEDIGTMADDIYDRCNFGYGEDKDGVLLLVSKNDREWYISTCGYGITAFTDAGIQYIGKQMKSDLSDGNYAAAFHTYIDQCDQFIAKGKTSDDMDTHIAFRRSCSGSCHCRHAERTDEISPLCTRGRPLRQRWQPEYHQQ